MPLPSAGLRARLLMLVLLVVVPGFSLMSYFTWVQRQEATRDVAEGAAHLAQLVVANEKAMISSTRMLLAGIAHLPQVIDGDARVCSTVLAALRRPYRWYLNFGLIAPSGRVRCSALPMTGQLDLSDRAYFRRALASRDLGVGDYQRGRITGRESINFGYPVIDGGGRVDGVVFAAVDLSWLRQFTGGLDLPDGATVTVTDDNGTVMARYPGDQPPVGRSIAGTPLAAAIRASHGAGTASLPTPDGTRRLYAFAPFGNARDGRLYVTIATPEDAALAPVQARFKAGMALLLAEAAGVLVLAWIGAEWFVLRRVRALAAAAGRLSAGDLSARTGLRRGGDELVRLARAFDDMATSLQHIERARRTASAGNRAVVRAADEAELLDAMCRIIVDVGGYRYAWVGFAEKDTGKTVRPVAQAGFEGGLEALGRALVVSWDDCSRGRGPMGVAIRTGRPYVAQNIHTDPYYAPWHEEALRRGYAAVCAFPLQVHGEVVGALGIYSDEPDSFSPDELELLAEAAEDLGFGMATLRTRADHDRANETIRRMAYYDALTGLPNHIYLEERIGRRMAAPDRHQQTFALMLLNMDRFREINDALGYHQGDTLLKETAARLQGIAADATVARMRGDEFAVLLEVRDVGHAAETALRVHDALGRPFMAADLTLDMSATVGIALYPQHGDSPAALIRHADVAKHQARQGGRPYAVYAREHDEDGTRRLALAAELRRAIEEDRLVLYYQPKIDLNTGEVCGVEALVRWIDTHQGMIPPDMFIPLAEHTGLIKPLTEWVLVSAMRQAVAWRGMGLALPVAVNLSARNLREPELAQDIEALLSSFDLGADALALEITESAVMEDPEGALATLLRLRELGVRLFIDDFGTGYSSLGYLKKLPVDSVKIDKSFVMDMLDNADSAAIVRSTISLAHDLSLYVVAEGIESEEVWHRLRSLGCDAGQGYHISKPLPPRQFTEWLHHRRTAAAKQ